MSAAFIAGQSRPANFHACATGNRHVHRPPDPAPEALVAPHFRRKPAIRMNFEGLIAEARERRPQPMPPRERGVSGATAVAFLAADSSLRAKLPDDRPVKPLVIAGLVLAYAAAHSVSFEMGSGEAFPNQLVQIPM